MGSFCIDGQCRAAAVALAFVVSSAASLHAYTAGIPYLELFVKGRFVK